MNKTQERWKNDPVAFAKEAFNFKISSQQREAITKIHEQALNDKDGTHLTVRQEDSYKLVQSWLMWPYGCAVHFMPGHGCEKDIFLFL